jgi:hypothetical protein
MRPRANFGEAPATGVPGRQRRSETPGTDWEPTRIPVGCRGVEGAEAPTSRCCVTEGLGHEDRRAWHGGEKLRGSGPRPQPGEVTGSWANWGTPKVVESAGAVHGNMTSVAGGTSPRGLSSKLHPGPQGLRRARGGRALGKEEATKEGETGEVGSLKVGGLPNCMVRGSDTEAPRMEEGIEDTALNPRGSVVAGGMAVLRNWGDSAGASGAEPGG